MMYRYTLTQADGTQVETCSPGLTELDLNEGAILVIESNLDSADDIDFDDLCAEYDRDEGALFSNGATDWSDC